MAENKTKAGEKAAKETKKTGGKPKKPSILTKKPKAEKPKPEKTAKKTETKKTPKKKPENTAPKKPSTIKRITTKYLGGLLLSRMAKNRAKE